MTRLTASLSRVAFALALLGFAAAAAALEFKPYGRGAFAQIRKDHAGRPLVVHFWSVTCAPCLAELPDWAKIARANKPFDLVFVNADQHSDRPRAQMRLEKAGLQDAAHYGFADDFVERLYFEADNTWRGELPFTALVGADGKLVTVIGAMDDPEIAKWLGETGKR
jgi:thiol-disulfide isomerase/thioredoxin